MLFFFLRPIRTNIADTTSDSRWTAGGGLGGVAALAEPMPGYKRAVRTAAGWVKRAVPAGRARRSGLRSLLACLLPWPLLRSTATDKSRAALRREAHRLVQWRSVGLPVPRVLAVWEDGLLTADAGPTLSHWLKIESVRSRRLALVARAARDLAQVHGAGYCHGRPALKDIAFDGSHLTFLDLDEEPVAVMPLATAQARDVLLFLTSSAGAFLHDNVHACLRSLWKAYLAGRPPLAVRKEVRRNYRLLKSFALPLRLLPRRWLGRDLGHALIVLFPSRDAR